MLALTKAKKFPEQGREGLRALAGATVGSDAFPSSFNRIAIISNEAIDPPVGWPFSFVDLLALVLANLLATAIFAAGALAVLAWWLGPTFLTRS